MRKYFALLSVGLLLAVSALAAPSARASHICIVYYDDFETCLVFDPFLGHEEEGEGPIEPQADPTPTPDPGVTVASAVASSTGGSTGSGIGISTGGPTTFADTDGGGGGLGLVAVLGLLGLITGRQLYRALR